MDLRSILRKGFQKVVRPFYKHGLSISLPAKIKKLLFSFLKNPDGTVEIQGNKMFLYPNEWCGITIRGVYDPLATELLKKEVKGGDVALDLGAHIGYYTLLFARLVGKEGKVFAFEPEPNNFDLLRKNVEINGYKNVTLVQKAVSNETGKAELYLSEKSSGTHKLNDLKKNRKFIEVGTIRLDDYFKDYNEKVDFIKIDIEGAEYLAIEGMPLLLEKNKNIKIITEFSPSALKEFGTNSEDFLRFFVEYGFKIFNLNENKKKIEPTNISKLLEVCTPEKGNSTDLFCSRENNFKDNYVNLNL